MATTKVPKPLSTAVGKKLIMGLTGLLLCVYLVGHLFGNLLLLTGASKFNAYAHFLMGIPILPLIELGLLAMFLIHAYEGVQVFRDNKRARPVGYQKKVWARNKSDKSRKSVASSTMIWTGVVILVFVVLHVWHFKYGPDYPVADLTSSPGTPAVEAAPGTTPGQAQEHVRNLAYLVISEFKKPWVIALYVISMILMGLHLYHAVSSAFQSLGVSNKRLERWILIGGKAFTIIIAGGFAILPVWIYLAVPTPPPPPQVSESHTTQSQISHQGAVAHNSQGGQLETRR